MNGILKFAAMQFLALTCLAFPSVYDQTIKDNVDHLIVGIEKSRADEVRYYGLSNVVVVPLSGERHNDTAHIPLSMFKTNDLKFIEVGNVIHVANRTNFTFTKKDKYPALRRVEAYMDNNFLTDDEYEVTLISVFTDTFAGGDKKGEKFSRNTISLKRLRDKASFDSMTLTDFEYRNSIHEGDIIRLVDQGKAMVLVKHKLYPWEKLSALYQEKNALPKP